MICECGKDFEQKEFILGGQSFKYPHICTECTLETQNKLEARAKAEREKEEAERAVMWIERSGIPKRYRDMTEFVPRNPSQNITWDFRRSLIFSGGTGNGKTMLACYIALCGIRMYRKTARYTTHADMISLIKSTWSSKIVSEEQIVSDLVSCDVLILDEIDKQPYTEYLFRVLDGRYNEERPTIIIGNATGDQIKQVLGEALVSRLRQQGAAFKQFAKIDYRNEN